MVAHRGDVGATGSAAAQHDTDLGDPSGAHASDVVEDAAEVVFVGEDFGLLGQKGPGRVDQVQTWQVALVCDFLCAEFFLGLSRKAL